MRRSGKRKKFKKRYICVKKLQGYSLKSTEMLKLAGKLDWRFPLVGGLDKTLSFSLQVNTLVDYKSPTLTFRNDTVQYTLENIPVFQLLKIFTEKVFYNASYKKEWSKGLCTGL